jgi:3-oxoacyl-[acyl-carrier-protein] synthase II
MGAGRGSPVVSRLERAGAPVPTSADPTSPAARVVITGIGVVSPNGVGRDAFARACAEGRSGISRLDARLGEFDTSALKTTAVAQVRDFDPSTAIEPTELRRVPRMIPMALAASRGAMQ